MYLLKGYFQQIIVIPRIEIEDYQSSRHSNFIEIYTSVLINFWWQEHDMRELSGKRVGEGYRSLESACERANTE